MFESWWMRDRLWVEDEGRNEKGKRDGGRGEKE